MRVKNMKAWHAEVCKGGRCGVCEHAFPPDYLCGHHIRSKGAHPAMKLETNNGICVCYTCHLGIHNGTIKIHKTL